MNFMKSLHRKSIWNVSFKFTKSYSKCVENRSEYLNQQCRIRLAAALRALNHYGLSEGILTHLSAKCPSFKGDCDIMLTTKLGQHWGEVTPSSLVGINEKNELVEGEGDPVLGAIYIHKAVYDVRPDIKCIIHTHMPYTAALTCIEDPRLRMIHQGSTRFYNRIAYDPVYGGLGITEVEAERIARTLKDKDVLFMSNHGVIVTADSIDVAFDQIYYLEVSAKIQVLAYSTNLALKDIDEGTVRMTSEQIWRHQIPRNSKEHLNSFIRQLSSTCEEFKILET